jgi:4-hydroxybenzoate polyprenyltransferase
MNSTRNYLWQCWRLMRGNQPTGFVLLLSPVLWSLWLAADGMPPLNTLIIFIAGAWCMRAAGCVINDMADRDIDPKVRRTHHRPLASRALRIHDALLVLVILLLCAFVLVSLTNTLTIMLAAPALLFATIYPFSKRWFYAPQLLLAMSFSFAVPMSFAAVKSELPASLWLIYCANICWVLAYDTMYAISDTQDDAALGIHSTALLMGSYTRLFIACMQAIVIILLICVGVGFNLSGYYYAGIGLVGLLFMHQQWLIRAHDPGLCLRAFVSNGIAGMLIATAIAVDFYLRVA